MQEEITSENMLSSDLVDDTEQTHKFVTASDKANWDSKIGATDYANYGTAGVIKVEDGYGLGVIAGYIFPLTITASEYDRQASNYFIGRGTLGNVLKRYQLKIDSENKLDADLVDDTTSTNKFVSSSDKTAWNAKYDKPNTGIPSTDMTSAVQTSLGKADTALQEHQDISGKEDKSNKVTSISSESTDTQYPSAKCVYDLVGDIESILETLDVGGGLSE